MQELETQAPFERSEVGTESDESLKETTLPSKKPTSKYKTAEQRRREDRTDRKDRTKMIKKALNILSNNDEDYFEIWGRNIAATIRHYPDPVAVRRFKSSVNSLMAQLEAGEMDNTDNTSNDCFNVEFLEE